jgi:hypothetical protein
MTAESLAALENIGKIRKTKTPPATGAGGVLEKFDDLNQIVNYLPASLVRDSFAMPSFELKAPDPRLYRISPMQTNIPKSVDHWVGWRWLVWFVERMTC